MKAVDTVNKKESSWERGQRAQRVRTWPKDPCRVRNGCSGTYSRRGARWGKGGHQRPAPEPVSSLALPGQSQFPAGRVHDKICTSGRSFWLHY